MEWSQKQWNEMGNQENWERWDWWRHQERGKRDGWNKDLRKEVEWRNKGVDRGDCSRYARKVRPLNTPSSRDSMEFEFKCVLKKWLMEWKRMKGREDERGRTRNWGHWKDQMGGRQDCWSWESENKDEERNEWNEDSLKSNKFGKTRKNTRWKRGEFISVEIVRKHNEIWGNEIKKRWKRDFKEARPTKRPDGRESRLLQ